MSINRIINFLENLLARFFFIPLNTWKIMRLQRKLSKMSRTERRRYEKELSKKVVTTGFKSGVPRKIRKRLARTVVGNSIVMLRRG